MTTFFAWLKAIQTGVALTALVLVLLCGNGIIRHWRAKPRHEGLAMAWGIFLIALAVLLPTWWQMEQYWLKGANSFASAPPIYRLLFNTLFLTGGAIFVSLAQPAPVPRGVAFVVWSALVAAIVLVIALTA